MELSDSMLSSIFRQTNFEMSGEGGGGGEGRGGGRGEGEVRWGGGGSFWYDDIYVSKGYIWSLSPVKH